MHRPSTPAKGTNRTVTADAPLRGVAQALLPLFKSRRLKVGSFRRKQILYAHASINVLSGRPAAGSIFAFDLSVVI